MPSWGYLLDTDMAYLTGQMTAPDWFVAGTSEPTSTSQARGSATDAPHAGV